VIEKACRLIELDSCPYCGSRSLEVRRAETFIPHFGRVLILTFSCDNCGYRHSDTIPLEEHGPSKHVIKVAKSEDLRIKIVRSGTASIEIPELGLRLDPGGEGQSFITNVEGILVRFEEAVNKLQELTHPSKMAELHKILHKIRLAREGKAHFTILLEDSAGDSSVIEDNKIS